jgi:CDP-diacylglycerol--glycerol-3-phosphate 3-phosphatidyltransferase
VAAIALDGLDGYLARTRGLATPLGAQIDILGDRVVENLFFTFFAVSGLVTLWVPVLFFARGAVTDFLRGLAARSGRNGFDRTWMLDTWWGRTLVASRASRGAYAVLKCVCFCCLGILLPLRHLPLVQFNSWLLGVGHGLTGITAAFCLVRGIPVIWEGRRYFASARKSPPVMAAGVIR